MATVYAECGISVVSSLSALTAWSCVTSNAPVTVYDRGGNAVAHLNLAFNVGYEKKANAIWRAFFSIPLEDPHASECTARRYVEIYDGDERIDLFQIVRKFTTRDGTKEVYRFECEHVFMSLIDPKIDATTYSGPGTSTSISDVLALQKQANWKLGTCGFDEQFLYKWTRGTSLLKALFDIPDKFREPFLWTWDTENYPWTLNLEVPSTSVTAYIDYGRNQKLIKRDEDMRGLVTRLYPHGAGAGADQITIADASPEGRTYLSKNEGAYGTIVKHWTDQNYTTSAQLYEAAVNYLDILSVPRMTYTVSAADLYQLTGESIDNFEIGSLVKITDEGLDIDIDQRVLAIKKSDLEGKPGDIRLSIGNVADEFDWHTYIQSNDLGDISIADITGGVMGQLPATPTVAGFYICTDYLGYHNGTDWKTYLDSAGRLWADHGGYYIHFDPAASPPLKIKADGEWIGTVSISQLTVGSLDVAMTLTTGGKIESSNFATGVSGWQIDEDGSAEFQDVTVRGSLNASDIDGGSMSGIYLTNATVVTGKLDMNANLDFGNQSIYNLNTLRGGSGTNDHILNLDDDEWKGYSVSPYAAANSSYLLLTQNAALRGHTDLTVDAQAGDLVLKAGDDIWFQAGGGTIAKLETIVATDSVTLKIGHEGLMTFDVGGVLRYLAFREPA